MTCQGYDDRQRDAELGDYVDGTLTGQPRAAFEAHLVSCAECRALVADFATLRAAIATLPPQPVPPGSWQRLAASLDERRGWWSRLLDGLSGGLPQQAGAAAMALVLTAGLTWVGSHLSTVSRNAPLAANAARQLSSPELALAEQHYATAIAGLEQITTSESQSLDDETAGVLRVNLTAIDTAIGESRAAVQTEPDNDVAAASFLDALGHKLALLQDAVALINEMRKGNPEGAARIVSEVNP
jgi:anti-sigma factor RsiW